jgi:CRISPR/Cas system CMR-associated protein Cmr1 (group 7 of RAMP superfamily)
MLAGNELKAVERAQALVDQGGRVEGLIYGSTKRASAVGFAVNVLSLSGLVPESQSTL